MATYITGKGGYNVICDVCGWQMKNTEVRKRWDGLIVCEEDWEMRHTLDFYKTRNDTHLLPFIRADSSDLYSIDFNSTASVSLGRVPSASNVSTIGTSDTCTIQVTIVPKGDMTTRQVIVSNAVNGTAGTFTIDVCGVRARAITVSVNPNGAMFTSPATLTPYQTYVITYVQNSGRRSLFINGVVQPNSSTTTYNAMSAVGTAPLDVGSLNSLLPFVGIIKDLRIWSTARTQLQIEQDVHATLVGTETGLLGWWKMNSGTGTTVSPTSTADATAIMTLTNTTWTYSGA